MLQAGVVVQVEHSRHVSALGVTHKPSAMDELAAVLHERRDHSLDHLLDGHDLDELNSRIKEKYGEQVPVVKARVTWDLSTQVNPCMVDLPYSTPDLDAVLPTITEAGSDPYLFKWDFKRCFHDIPLHPQVQQYICCEYQGRFLQATRAIFGGKVHPFVANTLTGETQLISKVAAVHPTTARFYPSPDPFSTSLWVDDNLGGGRDRQQALSRLHTVVAVASKLGWSIPQDHIDGPDRPMVFRGILFDPQAMTLSIPPAKLRRLHSSIKALLSTKHAPLARELRSLAGKCQWAASVMLAGRMHCQTLYDTIPHWQNNNSRVHIQDNQPLIDDLWWWYHTVDLATALNQKVWTSFWAAAPPTRCSVVSDAADAAHGFAAIIDGTAFVGKWDPEVVEGKSSAWRELIPILLAVHLRAPKMAPGSTLLIVSDNSAVAYALNKGSSPTPDIRDLLCAIVQCAADYHIHLVADWSPRQDIALLDGLSKLDKIVPRQQWPVW